MPNTTNQKTPTGTGSSQWNSTQKNGQNTRSTSQSSRPKGKSRFAQKNRSKKNVKPVVKPRGPVNTYTSVCCSVPATKPACARVDKKKALEQGLGSWHCTGCRKACKVTVSKFVAQDAKLLAGDPSVITDAVKGVILAS